MFYGLKDLLQSSKHPNSSIPVTSGPGLCVVSEETQGSQGLIFSTSQNCNFQPQARDPTTGQYFMFCSNACAAPSILPGLPNGTNVAGGPSTGTGGGASVNTKSNTALSLCAVSVHAPSRVWEFLNGSRSQAMQQKAEVQ